MIWDAMLPIMTSLLCTYARRVIKTGHEEQIKTKPCTLMDMMYRTVCVGLSIKNQKRNNRRGGCNIGYPFKTHLYSKSRDISFDHMFLGRTIILTRFTKFQNNRTTATDVMVKQIVADMLCGIFPLVSQTSDTSIIRLSMSGTCLFLRLHFTVDIWYGNSCLHAYC